ncbi:MAG: DUF4124 domain-containing protein [Thermodesulfobacteriota bacterium]
MRRIALFIFAVSVWSSLMLAFGQEVYRWVDEKGIVHFTDDPTLVPEKYRGQVQQKMPSKEPSPPQPTPSRPVEPSKTMEPVREIPPGSGAVQKDALGRGEEWWRATARDWNQKFVTYRTNYENAYNEWKAKEQELEEAKFKPDSLKRKLKSEIKELEEKAKNWEIQMNEAKNMIETVLPNQARDYRANPEWLKIEEKK